MILTKNLIGSILSSTLSSEGKMAKNRDSKLSLWFGVGLLLAGIAGVIATVGDPARESYLAVSVSAIIAAVVDIVLYIRRSRVQPKDT